jgi:hypothetical protein
MTGLREVVGADINDHQGGVESVELAVVEAPKDILRPIPSESEVE